MEPPLVLLHGFCESPRIFAGLTAMLPQEQRLLCPCLPGHGGTPWDPRLRSLDELAFWLRDCLDAAEVERCTLVGHSLGGYIAAAFAAYFPARLAGLCMLHSTALPDPPARKVNRDKALAFVADHGPAPFLKAFVQSLFHEPDPAWTEELEEITAQTDPAALTALLAIMRDRPDRTAALQALKVPVMYITGAHDTIVSPERAREEMAQIGQALLHRIPKASHMGMYETPDKVLAAIRSLCDLV